MQAYTITHKFIGARFKFIPRSNDDVGIYENMVG